LNLFWLENSAANRLLEANKLKVRIIITFFIIYLIVSMLLILSKDLSNSSIFSLKAKFEIE